MAAAMTTLPSFRPIIAPLCSQSLFQFVLVSDPCAVHLLLLTRCNQLDSNLANVEVTVEVG